MLRLMLSSNSMLRAVVEATVTTIEGAPIGRGVQGATIIKITVVTTEDINSRSNRQARAPPPHRAKAPIMPRGSSNQVTSPTRASAILSKPTSNKGLYRTIPEI